MVFYTIGHSNHPLERFLELLQRHAIQSLVDIRRFPASRSFPQFSRENLSGACQGSGIVYHWLEDLGGRRPKQPGRSSVNTGLRNESFRNYADYMQTDAFRAAVEHLVAIAASGRTAIMCAESVFWRCHRRLVSDFLVAQGNAVYHIFPSGEIKPHTLTDGARCESGGVSYPGQKLLFD